MAYLEFILGKRPKGRKTDVWKVVSAGKTNDLLASSGIGTVGWYSHWRRYVFEPRVETIFDPACLRELADFVERQTVAQKAK
jgi:hypothetical protein